MVFDGRPLARRAALVALTAAALVPWSGAARAQGAAPTPWLREAFPEMRADLERTPAFLRDTKLNLNLRTYYFDQEQSNGTYRKAWAGGGSLAYQSGWIADVFSIGGTFYDSTPIWAPEEYDGTKLLAPGQSPINVLGEAWAKLRWEEQVFTGWRQKIDLGYVNPQDNRMVPNTFEAAMFNGRVDWASYAAGYLWGMKPRERTNFVPLSQVAGVRLTPWDPLWVELNGVYVNDVFGTTFLNGEYAHRVNESLLFAIGLQYTDQRSTGASLIGDFQTWNAGARARVLFHGVGVEFAVGQTGDGFNIQTPFGSFPGYLSLINKDFDVAGQSAWGIKLTNDFSNLGVRGLTGFFWYADGSGAINPSTGAHVADFREYDFDLTYAPPRDVFGGRLHGFSVKGRVALVDQQGVSGLLPDYRVIVNYSIPLL